MRPPTQVYVGMIGAAILLAIVFRVRESEGPITEQQVREGNRASIEQRRDRLQDAIAENDLALADLRQAMRERNCEHLIDDPPPAYGECIGVETIEWCDLSDAERAILERMGANGRSCQAVEQ